MDAARASVRSSRWDEQIPIPDKSAFCAWITVPRGVGLFALISLVLGGIVTSFGILDLVQASQTDLRVFIRLDPVILKYKNPEYDGMRNYIPIWYAASIAGIIAGCIQSTASFWFIVHACIQQELDKKAKLWLMTQLLVSFMLLTILGGVFIAGFQPDNMIFAFGIDFILVNIFILGSMPIVRKEGKQPKLGDIRLLGGTSAFTALLML